MKYLLCLEIPQQSEMKWLASEVLLGQNNLQNKLCKTRIINHFYYYNQDKFPLETMLHLQASILNFYILGVPNIAALCLKLLL